MAGYMQVLLHLLAIFSSDVNTNYLLCHGQGKYLSYIPSPTENLLRPIGSLTSPCKAIFFCYYNVTLKLLIVNVEVVTGQNYGVYIKENQGPRTLSVLDDNITLGMVITHIAYF